MKLSKAQTEFMRGIQCGETPSKNLDSRTGKSLGKLGLVKFVLFVGWIGTPTGLNMKIER